jgi:hypothetical protein
MIDSFTIVHLQAGHQNIAGLKFFSLIYCQIWLFFLWMTTSVATSQNWTKKKPRLDKDLHSPKTSDPSSVLTLHQALTLEIMPHS